MNKILPLTGLIIADTASLLGNQIVTVALPVLVLTYTHSPMLTGVASAANFLPIVLAAFIGGRAIDHLGAWNLSVLSDSLSFFSTLLLPLYFIYFQSASATTIFLLVLLGALFDPTGVSAKYTMVTRLSDQGGFSLEKVNSLRGGLESGADFLGPLIGVTLIAAFGVVSTFFVNASSFLFCALVFAALVPRENHSPKSEDDTSSLTGVRFIFRERNLRALATMGIFTNFVVLPFIGLFLPILAIQKFDNVALLGISVSAFGLADTVGAMSFAWMNRRFSLTAIFYCGLLVTGLAIGACGFVTNEWQLVLAATVGGLVLGAGNPLEQTLMQRCTPTEIAGQVFTSMSALRFSSGPLGLLVCGGAAEYASVESALISVGALLVIAALVGVLVMPLDDAIQA